MGGTKAYNLMMVGCVANLSWVTVFYFQISFLVALKEFYKVLSRCGEKSLEVPISKVISHTFTGKMNFMTMLECAINWNALWPSDLDNNKLKKRLRSELKRPFCISWWTLLIADKQAILRELGCLITPNIHHGT